MNIELPIPYDDYIFIEPVLNQGVLQTTLNCYAKVLAIGPKVDKTEVGEYVAFEKWDKPEFEIEGKIYHFLREKDAIAKIPESIINALYQ